MVIPAVKRFLARFSVLLGAGVLMPLAMFTSTAHAGGWNTCLSGQLCVWTDANGNGTEAIWAGYWSPGSCVNVPPSINDQISSALNLMAWQVAFYRDANCSNYAGGSGVRYLNSGAGITNFGNWDINFNDRISSIKFL